MIKPFYCLSLCFFLTIPSLAPQARAEKIRSAVPGLNLNYLSIFTAEARGFFKMKTWRMKPS